MEILIAKCAALGDVLRTTSLLSPLARRHPKSRVTWLTSPQAKPLLQNNPHIHSLWTLAEARKNKAKRFDLVLSLEEDLAVASAVQAICRGELIGIVPQDKNLSYTSSSAPYYNMSLLNRDTDGGLKTADALKLKNTATYAELWLRVLGLKKPDRPETLRPTLRLTPQDRRAARVLAIKHKLKSFSPIIGFNPGAGKRWPAKQLSEEKSARLLKALHQRFGSPAILFGGKDETDRNRRILRLSENAAIDAGTGHDLCSFASFIELCEVLITTDSLAFHMATALSVKTVVLVGPTSAPELDVFGIGQKLVPSNGCSCFYKSRCSQKVHCLEMISDPNILSAAEKLLERSSHD